jgi:hypothetical protein
MLWWSLLQRMKAMIFVRSDRRKPSASSKKRCATATSALLKTTWVMRLGASRACRRHGAVAVHEAQDAALRVGDDDGDVPPPGSSSSGCGPDSTRPPAAGVRAAIASRSAAVGHAERDVAHIRFFAAVQRQDVVKAAGAAQVDGILRARHGLQVPGAV